MRKFSDNFRESLRGINEINTIISYKTDKTFYILTTENNDNILTQSEDYLVTQQGNYEIIEDNILSVNPLFNTDLFKSVCKTLEIETKEDIPIGTKIKVKIGVKVNENFEYMDFGYYYVKETSHSADSDSYYIIAYDKMYESMISYDDNNANIFFPITIKNLLINICNYLGWNYYFDNFINYDKVINTDLFKEQGLTYRDILDNISQVVVGNLIFDENDILKIKYINDETNNDIIVEERDLRNINVDIKEKYGPVNSLIITTNDNVVLNNLNDESSINQNGRTELQINDNYILINNSDDFIENMFNKIKGLQYYIYDINTIGLLIFEPLDRFKIKIGENIYSTILINDDLKITTGMEEDCFVEKPDTNVNEYKSTNADKNKLNNAVISLDKANANIKLNTEAINKNSQDIVEANASIELNSKAIDTANAEIVLKVNAQGKIVQVKLGANASTGSTFTIDADQVNLTANDILNLIAGNTINLTAKNIEIDSTNFKVDKDGNMTAKSGTFNGTVNTNKDLTVGNNAYIGQNQASASDVQKYLYFSNNAWIRRWIFPNTGGNYLRIQSDLNTGLACGSGHIYVLDGSIQMSHQPIIESDKRLKQKIKNIDVSFINDIKIKEFEYINTPGKKQIGVIAQDYINKEYSKYFLNKSLNDNGEEYYSVSYGNITNALIKYCQEMNKQIETLQNQINELKEMINNGKYKD